jgi:hypothetical protein
VVEMIKLEDIKIDKTSTGGMLTGTVDIHTGNSTSKGVIYYKVNLIHKQSKLQTSYHTYTDDKNDRIKFEQAFEKLDDLVKQYNNKTTNELTFTYKDTDGRISEKRIDKHSINICYSELDYYDGEQWILEAINLDIKDFEIFKIKDIIGDFSLDFITDTIKHKCNIKNIK